jgi:SAM-dependent methyltransferase
MSNSRIEAAVASEQAHVTSQLPWLDALPLRPGASILDIGAGPGYHCQYFRKRGLRPVACDRSPETFRFIGQIPIVPSLEELVDQRFDYVFASHVLEHCPDTFSALTSWRNLLADDGSIIIVVPPYFSEPTDDHWNIGWNISQLALLLVAAGFDCSDKLFMRTGHNICGMGTKRDVPTTYCNIKQSLPYLPAALAQRYYTSGPNSHIPGDVRLVDDRNFRPDITRQHHFPLSSAAKFASLSISREYTDWHIRFSPEIALPDPILLACFNEGHVEVALRLAVGSDSCGESWRNAAEKYFDLKPGLTCAWFQRADFTALRGNTDYDRIDQLSFGGAGTAAEIRFGLFDEAGRQLFVEPHG